MRVPKVYAGVSSKHLLVLEYLDGVRITDLEALERAGHDRRCASSDARLGDGARRARRMSSNPHEAWKVGHGRQADACAAAHVRAVSSSAARSGPSALARLLLVESRDEQRQHRAILRAVRASFDLDESWQPKHAHHHRARLYEQRVLYELVIPLARRQLAQDVELPVVGLQVHVTGAEQDLAGGRQPSVRKVEAMERFVSQEPGQQPIDVVVGSPMDDVEVEGHRGNALRHSCAHPDDDELDAGTGQPDQQRLSIISERQRAFRRTPPPFRSMPGAAPLAYAPERP